MTVDRRSIPTDQDLVDGLVSIMMPVMNGEAFLEVALDSILAQDYTNFEVTILDNLSTDGTPDICRRYAAADKRVRYVRDSQDRITHDASNHLATFIRGEFAAYACDDDLHDPTFLGKMIKVLRSNPTLALAYPNGAYVDINGAKGKRSLLKSPSKMSGTDSAFRNVWRYIRQRKVVPTLFGVYRTSALRLTLPFETFDETIADVDNLFMVRLLNNYPVQCVDEQLFWFRNKFRGFEPSVQKGLTKNPTALDRWLYQAKHQITFAKMLFGALNQSTFSATTKAILRVRVIYALVFFIAAAPLRSWVGRFLHQVGVREGITSKRDEHHEKRIAGHRSIGFRVNSSPTDPYKGEITQDSGPAGDR